MNERRVLLTLLLLTSAAYNSAWSNETEERIVGSDWTWFTDYAYLSAEWTLNVEDGCELEVGTGIKAFGKPRGSKHRFSRHYQFTTWGIGAIHVRAIGGKPCRARLDQGDVGALPILRDDFQ